MSEEETNGIGKRLREVRGDMTQTEFGEVLGVHMNSIVRYESGKSTPDAATIKKLFDKLQVDPTWLITGQRKPIEEVSSDDGSKNSEPQKNGTETLGQRLRGVREQAALNQAEFAEKLGVVGRTIYMYETDKSIPDGVFLLRLKELFGVDPAWLLLGDESCGLEPDEHRLLEMYRNSGQQKKVIGVVIQTISGAFANLEGKKG